MKPQLTRRDFLKSIAAFSLVPLSGAIQRAGLQQRSLLPGNDLPNIIILLFDALSASNVSLYGYPRKTMPNLEKFAKKAAVYHAHYAAGSYTVPSTASLLTSTYPWAHRAFHNYSPVAQNVRGKNLFGSIGEDPAYHRLAFSQNLLADGLLHQFGEYLDEHLDSGSFSLINQNIHHTFFKKDGFYGLKGVDEDLLRFAGKEPAGSLVFSLVNKLLLLARYNALVQKLKKPYPRGISGMQGSIHFTIEPVIDGTIDLLSKLTTPSLAYFHFFFPHGPYVASKKYVDIFRKNDLKLPDKPTHPFSKKKNKQYIIHRRQAYDEYIANIDAEFGRLVAHMQATGLLDNSYVIVTSDHGELFERGDVGHSTRLVYEPLIRIPLVISRPQQQEREDIFTLTNTVDLLPSLLHISGHSAPDWCEGQVLPGLGGEDSPDRSVYSLYPHPNDAGAPLTTASIAIIKGQYKLISFRGYTPKVSYEFYDLKQDPEELVDLYRPDHSIAQELRAELEKKLDEVNQPYLNPHTNGDA